MMHELLPLGIGRRPDGFGLEKVGMSTYVSDFANDLIRWRTTASLWQYQQGWIISQAATFHHNQVEHFQATLVAFCEWI